MPHILSHEQVILVAARACPGVCSMQCPRWTGEQLPGSLPSSIFSKGKTSQGSRFLANIRENPPKRFGVFGKNRWDAQKQCSRVARPAPRGSESTEEPAESAPAGVVPFEHTGGFQDLGKDTADFLFQYL